MGIRNKNLASYHQLVNCIQAEILIEEVIESSKETEYERLGKL